MIFNGDGYLEPGLHSAKIEEVEKLFVTGFPFSSTRKNIIEGYKRHLAEISAIVPEFHQFLDGSFISNKNDPGDIDLVCFIDGDLIDRLPSDMKQKIGELLSGPSSKARYMCDAYFAVSYPETHPLHASARQQRKYWMGEFGFDRQDVPKGVIVVQSVQTASPENSHSSGNIVESDD